MNPTYSQQVIAIQDIQDDSISINVNGEIRKIQNELSELKTLLQNLDVQNVQYAEKIYNIEQIDEANFGYLTGKKSFNEHLTKVLIESMKEAECIPAENFLKKVKGIPNWEKQMRISDKAKEIIAYSFVGVIGIQLGKLMAIGKEDFSEVKQRKYLQKVVFIVQRVFDLINFAFLSRLWDAQQNQPLDFSDKQQQALSHFFQTNFERSIEEQLELFRALYLIFEAKGLASPFPKLEKFTDLSDHNSSFCQACSAMQAFNQKLDSSNYDLMDCLEAEKQLALFLNPFNFLVNYNMASIKRIGYKEVRNTDPKYLHRYTALGIDSKANVDAEKVIYTPDTVNTDAVLLYQGEDYQNNTNLFPFVIDYNALTFEHGAKVCFYQTEAIEDGSLNYLFLEDGKAINIEMKAIIKEGTDYNELMLQEENQKILNLDNVIAGFRSARKSILANQIDFDDL